jgi:hypothetical protein
VQLHRHLEVARRVLGLGEVDRPTFDLQAAGGERLAHVHGGD